MTKRTREPLEYIEFARRVIKAAGKNVSDADEFELRELVELRTDLEAAITAAVEGQRAIGRSWAYIGDALGITRQAAQQRYAKRDKGAPSIPTEPLFDV